MRKVVSCLMLIILCLPSTGPAASPVQDPSEHMSSMGALAWRFAHKVHGPDGEKKHNLNAPGNQEETTIAVDSTGQHLVMGFNDGRAIGGNPLRASGYAYSDDGGVTWVDGGLLPSPGNQMIGADIYPQIWGDPDVKYIGGCTFLYMTLMAVKSGPSDVINTIALYRSTDCGHTFVGPFEVTPATVKNGFADKEYIDVDPETGRVIVGWINFGTQNEISVSYTDNIMATPPTWSNRKVVSRVLQDGGATIPRFAGNSSKAYLAWVRHYGSSSRAIAFSVSNNNGATWSDPVEVGGTFTRLDEVIGVDRLNAFPGLAVDNSPGPYKGTVYLVYPNNNSKDGGDIILQRSTTNGATFENPVALNSRPGKDRSQWMPWVTVDSVTGRVYVVYYDQSAGGGDLTEVTYLYSDNGGTTWTKPAPLTNRPFHSGYGDDSSAPNLGDYIQAVSLNNKLYSAFPGNPQVLGYADGQPTNWAMNSPDIFTVAFVPTPHASVNLGTISFTDSGGNTFINAGETVTVGIQLNNYDTNPLHASQETGITAQLTTSTSSITIQQGNASYPNLLPGAAGVVLNTFSFAVSPTFQPGTRIELTLNVTTSTGTAALPFTLATGTPVPTSTLLSENFNTVTSGVLPSGWSAVHMAGATTTPWTTSQSFCSATSNAAYHVNTEGSAIERLWSPEITIPANAQYVTLEFDICYDLEDWPFFNIFAYDGMMLRIADLTPGRTLRSVMISSFAEEFMTGSRPNYPKHLSRSADPNYLQMINVWSGPSSGWQHVRLKLPGMEGSTVQLRFDYTQDTAADCKYVRPESPMCGIAVDNVVMQAVVSQ